MGVAGMKLRKRLLSQSVAVLLSTVLITVCIGTVFGHFYGRLHQMPFGNEGGHTDVIVLKEDEVIYAGGTFGEAQVYELCMHMEMQHERAEIGGKTFALKTESFRTASGAAYRVLKVSPIVDFAKGYRTILVFVICVFLLSFLIASFAVLQYNRKHIIEPIVHLKEATEELTAGNLKAELPDEGEGEVYELHKAIEQLRVKLQDNVWYERKFDENRQFLVSSISHDLKTPVTAVRGYIEGVLDGVAATDEKRRAYLEKALEKTEQIHNMIDDLMLYSKLDLHRVAFEMKRVEITEYMRSYAEEMRFIFQKEEKQLEFRSMLRGAVYVMLDAERFRRVIQNVLDNAKRYIQPGNGKVTITIRQRRHHVILEIRDNGIGIKQEELPHIFERFYRADGARKARGSGGLGLAIAKQIVEAMNGRIWATSNYGEGACILISLPSVSEN